MILFSKRILFIISPEYAQAEVVLILLALGQFVNAAVGSNGLMLSMTKFQHYEMINGIIIAALNIFLNIILVPKYGIIGSAIGGMLSISSVNIIKTIEVYIALKMVPYNGKYLKLIVAGVGTAIIVSVFRNVTLGRIWYVCNAWYEFSDYDGYTGDHWVVSGR